MALRDLVAADPLCAHGADPSPISIIEVEEQIIEFKKVAAMIAEASPTSMDGELTLRRSQDDGNDRARERGHAPCGDSTASASIVPIISATRRRSSWLDPPSPLEGTRPRSTSLGSTSAASAPFTLDTTSHRSMDNAPAPDAHLPPPFLTPTNVHEREMYAQELIHRLVHNKTTVELSWQPRSSPRSARPVIELLCVFVDMLGSLSAIASTLASLKINILGLSAFSTDTGIAIDTFEVDRFDESAAKSLIACMEGLYFSFNLPTPLMLVSASSPSHSPASSHSASIRGGDSFVRHMSELSQRSPRPLQTERGSAVAALRFKSLLRNLALGSSNGSARHTAR